MSDQACLPFDEQLTFEELMRTPATWYEGEPDRSGLAQFTVAIRSRHDPEPLTRKQKHARGEGFEQWRAEMVGDPRRWAAAIVRLLRDRQSRTFNRIVLDLTEMRHTADVALGKPPEDGLWLAVRRGLVWWAHLPDGATWFAARPTRCHS